MCTRPLICVIRLCRAKEAAEQMGEQADADVAEMLAHKQEQKLLVFCAPPGSVTLPPQPDLDVHVQHAKAFRRSMKEACTLTLCAVCSIPKRATEVSSIEYNDIPSLSLLKAGSAALTTATINGEEYVLQPDAVNASCVHICSSCHRSLEMEKIPMESLASFDAGPIPRALTDVQQLVPLNMVEENLVARYQVCRSVACWQGCWQLQAFESARF